MKENFNGTDPNKLKSVVFGQLLADKDGKALVADAKQLASDAKTLVSNAKSLKDKAKPVVKSAIVNGAKRVVKKVVKKIGAKIRAKT